MLCKKCNTKNVKGAKFCKKCGNKLTTRTTTKKKNNKTTKEIKKEETIIDKYKKLPKKKKILVTTILIFLIILLGALCFYLNIPSVSVERNLNRYFETSDKTKLANVKKVFRNNQNKVEETDKLIDVTKKVFNKWVDEFNKYYDDEEKLESSYNRYKTLFQDMYAYFTDSEYMLSNSFYLDYIDKIDDLAESKLNYFKGKEYKVQGDDFNTYYYYKNVIDSDIYYDDVKGFISAYLRDEIDKLKIKAEDYTKNIKDDSTLNEIILTYINKLNYLYSNSSSTRVDLSSSEEYKELVNNTIDKILENLTLMTEEKNVDYVKILKYVDESLKYVKENSDGYNKLKEYYDKYKDKKPDLLVLQSVVDYDYNTYGYNTSKTIKDVEYNSYLAYLIYGKTLQRTYNIDKKYKTLKSTIVTDGRWPKKFEGKVKIYGDDKVIYTSKTIKNDTKNIDINVDVTGVKNLKVEFITKSSESSWTSYYIYLVEPYLYK